MKKILMTFLICFSFLMIFTGCVSTNKEPPMFVDWEGKATGSKYPAWLEDIMLEKDADELEKYFPQIKDNHQALEIYLSYGEDKQSCKIFFEEKEHTKEEAQLLAQTWGKLSPEYEEIYVTPYISAKIYLRNE